MTPERLQLIEDLVTGGLALAALALLLLWVYGSLMMVREKDSNERKK